MTFFTAIVLYHQETIHGDLIWRLIRVRINGKLEEGQNVGSVMQESSIAHSSVSGAWSVFKTMRTAVRHSEVIAYEKQKQHMIIIFSYRRKDSWRQLADSWRNQRYMEPTTGYQILCFTMARRLHKCVPYA